MDKMEASVDKQNSYQIIGEFVTKVNTIEFLVNFIIEQVVGQYSEGIDSKIEDDIIKEIQKTSIRIRIHHIILFLNMTKGEDENVRKCIEALKAFANYYNANIRDLRDFIAHNAYL